MGMDGRQSERGRHWSDVHQVEGEVAEIKSVEVEGVEIDHIGGSIIISCQRWFLLSSVFDSPVRFGEAFGDGTPMRRTPWKSFTKCLTRLKVSVGVLSKDGGVGQVFRLYSSPFRPRTFSCRAWSAAAEELARCDCNLFFGAAGRSTEGSYESARLKEGVFTSMRLLAGA